MVFRRNKSMYKFRVQKGQRKFLRYVFLKEYGYYLFLISNALIKEALEYVSLFKFK